MEVEGATYPSVDRRDDDRTAVCCKAKMTDQGLVKYRIDRLDVIDTALWQASDL